MHGTVETAIAAFKEGKGRAARKSRRPKLLFKIDDVFHFLNIFFFIVLFPLFEHLHLVYLTDSFTLQIKPKVGTVCFGVAASQGALLLAGGEKGMRYAMPNARIMIHQPQSGCGVCIYFCFVQSFKEEEHSCYADINKPWPFCTHLRSIFHLLSISKKRKFP